MRRVFSFSLKEAFMNFVKNRGTVNVLFLGDVVGPDAAQYLRRNLPAIKKKYEADITVVNAENASIGNGLTPELADTLFFAGADVLTGGNHIFRQKSLYQYLDDTDAIVRPANYPPTAPGRGYCILKTGFADVLVVNLQGTTFMEPLDNSFDVLEGILAREEGNYDFAVLDFHAEATSEKKTLANAFDGSFAVIVGTHTHVRTADLQILKNGTGYITDLGMCGVEDSSLGVNFEDAEYMMRTHLPRRFTLAKGKISVNGAVFNVDRRTGKTLFVENVYEKE